MSAPACSPIRCRQIAESDIPQVAALLARGFPGRPAAYWLRGLARQRARALPPELPRYGYMLDRDGAPAGTILMLFAPAEDGGWRCNLSSWYVDPDVRGYASLLLAMALKRKDTTYVNISPAPHTWPTVEAQGFARYAGREFIAMPALARAQGDMVVRAVGHAEPGRSAAHDLLAAHAAFGCISLMAEGPGGEHPFVFVPLRIRKGRLRLPVAQLVYCRDLADFVRCARPLGRHLLARGLPLVMFDAEARPAGLPGFLLDLGRRKYFKGPQPPRPGDLAYTELALFGS
jgi:hypothetical protein